MWIFNWIALAVGAAGVRWSTEYTWVFEWIVYAALLAAVGHTVFNVWRSPRGRSWCLRHRQMLVAVLLIISVGSFAVAMSLIAAGNTKIASPNTPTTGNESIPAAVLLPVPGQL